MTLEMNIPDLAELKKSYDDDGYNHIPALFSKATLADLPATHSKNAHTRPNKAVVFNDKLN